MSSKETHSGGTHKALALAGAPRFSPAALAYAIRRTEGLNGEMVRVLKSLLDEQSQVDQVTRADECRSPLQPVHVPPDQESDPISLAWEQVIDPNFRLEVNTGILTQCDDDDCAPLMCEEYFYITQSGQTKVVNCKCV